MARPTKKSPERITAILNLLKVGNTRRAAAAGGDINYDTLREWMLADPELSAQVVKAEAEAEQRFLGVIARAAVSGTWTASAWWLERRLPQQYARSERLEMTGKDGGPIESRTVESLPDHERQALADAIRAHLRSEGEPAGSPTGAGED